MESKAFNQLTDSIREQLDKENLEYALIICNPQDKDKECVIGISSSDRCETLTSTLVNEATENKPLPRCFVEGIVRKLFSRAVEHFKHLYGQSVKKDLRYS